MDATASFPAIPDQTQCDRPQVGDDMTTMSCEEAVAGGSHAKYEDGSLRAKGGDADFEVQASEDKDENNKRSGQKDSGVCLLPPRPTEFYPQNHRRRSSDFEAGKGGFYKRSTSKDDSSFVAFPKNHDIYSYAQEDADRRGSGFSDLSEADGDTSRSGSIDSACDVHSRPNLFYRLSLHDPIPEFESAVRENFEDAAENDESPVVLVNTERPEEILPQRANGTVYTDRTEEATAMQGPHPTVRFIRCILSVLGLCILPPATKVGKEPFANPAYSDEMDGSYRPTDSAQAPRPTPFSTPSEKEPDKHSAPSPTCTKPTSCQTSPVDLIQNVTLEKNDFLESFDMMCSAAKKMGIDVVGRVVQVGNFAAAILDSRGGYLSIDALDVHLYVPPGAIPVGNPPQKVYIFVQGGLTSNHNYLTPCVHCGPSTCHFSKDVILTFPHCASDASSDKFTCVKSSSDGRLKSIKNGVDGVVLVGSKSVTMTMDHFCGYGAHGPISAKFMIACVFINDDYDVGKVWIRVRLLDETKANLQEIEREESTHGFILADTVNHFEVKRAGGDVRLSLCSEVDSWKIIDPQSGQQTIQHSFLWRDYGPNLAPAVPSKLFKAKTCNSSNTISFEAHLKMFQDSRKEHGVEFVVKRPLNAAKAAYFPLHHIPEEQIKKIVRQQMLEQLQTPCHTSLLDAKTYRGLCDLLDQPRPDDIDWHILPENLMGRAGYGHGWVKGVEERAQRERRSPTEIVLDIFFSTSRESGKGKTNTLQELKQGLLKMSSLRPDVNDAVTAIEDQLMRGSRREGVIYCPELGKHESKTTYDVVGGSRARGGQQEHPMESGHACTAATQQQPGAPKDEILLSCDPELEPDGKIGKIGHERKARRERPVEFNRSEEATPGYRQLGSSRDMPWIECAIPSINGTELQPYDKEQTFNVEPPCSALSETESSFDLLWGTDTDPQKMHIGSRTDSAYLSQMEEEYHVDYME